MSVKAKAADSYRLVHWNIKELDSVKLSLPEHKQVASAAEVLTELQPDLLSLNELHYDTARDNLQDFLQRCQLGEKLRDRRLSPSNTGLRSDPDKKLHDHSNFGAFPGQYATGFASSLPIERSLEVQSLRWLEWEPNRDLSVFDLGGLRPDEIELFDKSFSVHWLSIAGRSLAIICLHAVPAYLFGQNKSPNIERNRAQLEFLYWFLLGEPDPYLSARGIEPLAKDQAFIALGDFNCPRRDRRLPGAAVLDALMRHPRIHALSPHIPASLLQELPRFDPNTTYFADGWDYQRRATQLDYILVSRDLRVQQSAVIFARPERQVHGLFDPEADLSPLLASLEKPDRVLGLQRARGGRGEQIALVSVSKDFARLRAASDHLPLLVDFSW